jgi:hypothetical protein
MCVYLGNSSQHHGHLCLDTDNSKIYVARHAKIDDKLFPFHSFPMPCSFTPSNSPNPWLSISTTVPLHTVTQTGLLSSPSVSNFPISTPSSPIPQSHSHTSSPCNPTSIPTASRTHSPTSSSKPPGLPLVVDLTAYPNDHICTST